MEPVDVVVVERDRMNLLGLLLSSVLERALATPAAARHARALRGDVAIEASGMAVTMRFEAGRVEVRRGLSPRPRATIRGTLTALLGAALGRGRAWSLLTGRLRPRGNLFALWRAFVLLRAR